MSRFTPFAREAIEQSIGKRFEEQVRRHPGRLAVKSPGDAWSYAELDEIVTRIAHAIVAARGSAEEPVALVLDQGALLLAAILGALKAGKIYVPLDPAFPRARIGDMLADSQAPLILADERTRSLAMEAAAGRAAVLDVGELELGVVGEQRLPEILPGAHAYIYYTSGSTGRPKGVLDTHRNVLHNVMRYTNSLRIAPDDRLTLLQGPSFSGAVSSMFAALLNGAAVFPFDVPKEGADRIAGWLGREAITIYHSVPSLFRHVATSGESFPALRIIRLEGDRASAGDIELYQKHFSAGCALVNGLGATECGIVRQYFVGPETPIPEGVVPIGYPVEDMEILLLDESGQAAGAGQVGEIAVRSRYLVPGYWRQPELTAAAFVADPAGGLRIYRTGDLGRMRPDGCLEHLGRKDSQVKIRGNRVEAAEVEAALLGIGTLKEAAVVTYQEGGGEPRLVAYVVPATEPAPSTTALRRHLAERLPDYMIPSTYIVLAALPLNANRKVDRRALPAPDGRRPELDEAFVAPYTMLQLQLALIWQSVLGVEPVGIRDGFFELGGHSLLAVQMMDQVERVLDRKLPLSVLLAGATIEHLADAIQKEAGEVLAPVVTVEPRGTQPPFFFLHGDYLSGGFYCASLARQLGPDQPFHALPPCGVEGRPVPSSYEAMAHRHLEALRSVQPEGPYRLGGLCNGGLVAFEMARLLVAQGQRVDVLVVVAASASNTRPTWRWLRRLFRPIAALSRHRPDQRRHRLVQLHELLTQLDGMTLRERAAFALSSPRKIWWLLQSGSAAAPGVGPEPERAGGTPQERRTQLRRAYLGLDAEYVPRRYAGPVTLLWPSEDPARPAEAARWWRRVAPRVDVRVVPGTHATCLIEHVGASAEVLRRCLREARGR